MVVLQDVEISVAEKLQLDDLTTRFTNEEIMHMYCHNDIPYPIGEWAEMKLALVLLGGYTVRLDPVEQTTEDMLAIKIRLATTQNPTDVLTRWNRVYNILKDNNLVT